jgi:hypothetical protein
MSMGILERSARSVHRYDDVVKRCNSFMLTIGNEVRRCSCGETGPCLSALVYYFITLTWSVLLTMALLVHRTLLEEIYEWHSC